MRSAILARSFACAIVCLNLGGAARLPAAEPAPKALAMLEHGEWVLKDRETGEDIQRICLGDTRQLLKIRHNRDSCTRFVVTDEKGRVSVTNDCGAAGNERTDIRIETPRLFQLQSQGIADGAPFARMIEGRRVGTCR